MKEKKFNKAIHQIIANVKSRHDNDPMKEPYATYIHTHPLVTVKLFNDEQEQVGNYWFDIITWQVIDLDTPDEQENEV